MVGAGNFGRKLQATISDAPYKYMYSLMGLSEIVACNFRPKLPAPTAHNNYKVNTYHCKKVVHVQE